MRMVHTEKAPKAIGPYSQAVSVDKLLFCSGQIPLHPETMEIVGTDIEAQTQQVLRNMAAVLAAEGLTPSKVVKTTVFLKDFNDFSKMNAIYETFFAGHKPARSTVEVARLPKDVKVEIECIASY